MRVLDPNTAEPAVETELAAPEAFSVHDAATANWLVRRIAEARAYAKHAKEWAEAEVRRAEREEQFFLQRYGGQLEAWVRQEIDSPRRKSLKLPAGTVGFRTTPPKLDVLDEAKLVAWCRRSLPDGVREQVHLVRTRIKEHVEQTGEVPEGAAVNSGVERFYVR